MLVLLFLRTISHYLITFFPDYYISELLISFLPYSMLGHYIAILICLILIIRRRRRLSKVHRIAHLCLYALIYLAYLTTSTYLHTYITSGEGLEGEAALSFLYANILYTNTDTAWLLKTIRTHNPDIVMLVEYADHQDQIMRKKLLVNYPYTSHYKPLSNKWYDGDIIYSRYPLTRVDTSDSPRAYNHVVITKQTQRYNIVLVHTAAPVTMRFRHLRKRQMQTLAEHLGNFLWKQKTKNIVMFGDFNITPWADQYHAFATTMKKLHMDDVTTDLSSFNKEKSHRPMSLTRAITTWWHSLLPFARAHIDHFRAGEDISASYHIIDIPGSDHDGFVGTLQQ